MEIKIKIFQCHLNEGFDLVLLKERRSSEILEILKWRR